MDESHLIGKQYATQVFPSTGVLNTDFTEEELKPIWDEINKIQSNFSEATPHNKGLVGHIKQEYTLTECRSHLESLIIPFIYKHKEHFTHLNNISVLTENCPYTINTCWVNFQKKHEFNPLHNHDGIMSFVIWMKIPYDLQKELEVFPDARAKRTSCFEFVYIDSLGKIFNYPLPVDKTWEGRMVLFPAHLNHCVNPFYTSDDYRISVSGNIVYKVA